jgi:glycosyltransferase involved in cell wall biosynthesis
MGVFKFASTELIQLGAHPSDPLFSIIIINYNYGRYLNNAIESIRCQTFRNFELIVVDDGSTDDSLSKATQASDACVIRTGRLRQARACLEAIRYSRGQYIYILDADDIADCDLLDTVRSELGGKPSKIQFQLRPITGLGHDCGKPFPEFPEGYRAADMRADIEATGMYLTPQTSGNVFSRRVFEHIDDVEYEGAIDGVSLLLAPFLGEVRSISRPLGRYRLHGGNESRQSTAERYRKERMRFIDRLDHLGRILADRNVQFALRRPPAEMLFVVDRLFLEGLCGERRPEPRLIAQYLAALRRERSLSNVAKVALWVIAAAYGPKRLSRYLAKVHDEPWSPIRTVLRSPWKRKREPLERLPSSEEPS